MTGTGRAVLGAALGAAITLVLHPTSRPFLTSIFISPRLTGAVATEGIPSTPPELAEWMLAAGNQAAEHRKLTPREFGNVIVAAKTGAANEPNNAFWRQMLAALYHIKGDDGQARQEWMRASNCDQWNDHQSTVLFEERDTLARQWGAYQAWQLAYTYYLRSDRAVTLISSYARTLDATTTLGTLNGLLVRAANVRNGNLIRLGSRSLRIGDIGGQISEAACHPNGLPSTSSRHKLLLARLALANKLRQAGQTDLGDEVNRIYREMDAWYAFTDIEAAGDKAYTLGLRSLATAALPSLFAALALVGLVVWIGGRAVQPIEHVRLAPAVAAGTVLGLGAFSVTLLPLAALTTLLCCVFLVYTPKHERRRRPTDLGPLFSFMIGMLGISFALLLGAFLLGVSSPAVSVLPSLDVPTEYYGGSGVLLGLAVIVLALVLLVAPLYALATRYSTAHVLGLALRGFGIFLAVVGLAGVVIGTPLCIYEDHNISKTLNAVVANEPVYYLTAPYEN